MDTFDFTPEFLHRAKEISLADMLDSPFCQMWIVSAMSNMLINADRFDLGDQDDYLRYRMERVLYKIPREERMALFAHCRNMINQHREERMAKEAA